MEVETKFHVLNQEFSHDFERNPINNIQSRIKRMQSIKEKLERYGFPKTIESIQTNLNNVAGVRVICAFQEDVYTLAEAFLNQDDITLVKKKDYKF